MKSGYIEGKILKEARMNKNITQFTLYHMTGVHQSKISLYENSTRVLIDNPHIKIIMDALGLNDSVVVHEYGEIKYSDWRNSIYNKLYNKFHDNISGIIINCDNLTEVIIKGIIDERIHILLGLIDTMYKNITQKINNSKLNPYIHKHFYNQIENIIKIIHINKYTFKIPDFIGYINNILDQDNTELKIAMDTLNEISYKIDLQ